MSTKLILAIAASLLLTTQIAAQVPGATPQKLNAILCDTEEQAIQLASSQASGQTEPMAINLVNKAAGAEVCGRYIGYAVVEIEKTENKNGGLFMLAGLRFSDDGRLGWTASWVSPFNSTGLARGT
ncbi:MAG TPA: hypothetical protein VNO69_09895 [Methyloceanibacter sp.]|nr:hypothetical protein [Methyloceanibacter sp.]